MPLLIYSQLKVNLKFGFFDYSCSSLLDMLALFKNIHPYNSNFSANFEMSH